MDKEALDPNEVVEVVEVENISGESVFINKSDFQKGLHKLVADAKAKGDGK